MNKKNNTLKRLIRYNHVSVCDLCYNMNSYVDVLGEVIFEDEETLLIYPKEYLSCTYCGNHLGKFLYNKEYDYEDNSIFDQYSLISNNNPMKGSLNHWGRS